MLRKMPCAVAVGVIALSGVPAAAQATLMPMGAKVFLQRMGGFEADLTVALIGSNVPVVIVTDRKEAEFELSGRRAQVRGRAFVGPESLEEATITITDTKTGIVLDAYTLAEETVSRLARACALRLQEKIAIPRPPERVSPPAPASSSTPAVTGTADRPTAPTTAAASARFFVQGDLNHLADFIATLRTEFRVLGLTAEIVQRDQEYDYNVVFVQSNNEAAAVALDRAGLVIASAVDSGFRAKGATEGCARTLARRLMSVRR